MKTAAHERAWRALATNLRRLMRERNFNQKQLALTAELGETNVRDLFRGRSKDPRLSTIASLARVLQVSLPELLAGTYPGVLDTLDTSGLVSIRWLDDSGRVLSLPAVGLKGRIVDTVDQLRVFTADSDNMGSTIRFGEHVIIDLANTDIRAGGVFLIADHGRRYLHRITAIPGSPGKIRLVSDNQQYPPHDIALKSVEIIGRAIRIERDIE